jgi:phage-related protein
MADESYVIDIVLRARDQLAGVLAKGAAEVAGFEKAVEKGRGKLQDFDRDVTRVSDNLRNKFNRTLEDTAASQDKHRRSTMEVGDAYRELSREADAAEKKLKSMNMDELSRNMTKAADDVKKADAQVRRFSGSAENNAGMVAIWNRRLDEARGRLFEAKRGLEDANRAADDFRRTQTELVQVESRWNRELKNSEAQVARNVAAYEKEIRALARRRQEIDAAKRSGGVSSEGIDSMERDFDVQAARVQRRIDEINKSAEDAVKLRLDLKGFEADAAKAELIKSALGSDMHINLDTDMGAMIAKMPAIEALKAEMGRDVEFEVKADFDRSISELLHGFNQEMEHSRASIAGFDNQLRGMLAFGAVALFQPLLTMAGALAGELVSLAGSAVMAGGALGGALVAGASAALPVLGLLVGAAFRVANVMQAVQQQTLMRKQQFADAAKGDTAAANSLDSVANAADAVRKAQIGLTQAREEARRQLQDLILTEKEAQLAAQGAALSQEEAQRRLASSVLSGDIGSIQSNQLDVQRTALARQRADMEAARASQDLSRQRRGSVLAPDQSVRNAEQTLAQAKRALDDARRTSADAQSNLVAAESNLKFFLSQLSDSERELYQAIMRIRGVWNHQMRPITDSIIESFTFAVKRVTHILQDPDFIKSAQGLADTVSDAMDRITTEFTSPKWIEFWEKMMKAAGKFIEPLTGSFLQLANIFRRIALAARPVFGELIDLIGGSIDKLDDFVGRGKDLRDFFDDAGKDLKAWWRLAESIFGLFAALVGSSAETGRGEVRKLTATIREWTDWIDSHAEDMKKFWEDSADVVGTLAGMVASLGKELVRSFRPETAEAFGNVFNRIVVPALGGVVRLMGQFVIILDKLSQHPALATLAKLAIAGTIFGRVFRTFGGMLVGVVSGLARMAGAAAKVGESIGKFGNFLTRMSPGLAETVAWAGGWARAFGAVALRVTGVIGVVISLIAYAGRLGDVWDAIKDAASTFFEYLSPALNNLKEAFERLVGSLTGGGSFSDVLKFLGNLIADILIPAIKIFANLLGGALAFAVEGIAVSMEMLTATIKGAIAIVKAIGRIFVDIFGGIKDFIGGWVKIIDGIIHGDFGQIWDGIKQVIVSPFKAAWDIIKDIWGGISGFFGNIADGIGNAFDGIGDFISKPFETAVGVVKDVINWMISNVINHIPGIPDIDTISENPPTGSAKTTQQLHRRQNRANHLTGPGYAGGGRVGFATGGNVASAVGDAFGSVTGAAGGLVKAVTGFNWGKLPDWMSGLGDFLKDKIIDLIKSVPGKVWDVGEDVTGFLDPLGGGGPNITDLFHAAGGHVDGPSGLDVIPAWLTKGEFVVTPHGESLLEQITGVPGILSWIAGAQQRATGYAEGGRAGGQGGGRPATRTVQSGLSADALNALLDTLGAFGGKAISMWNDIWDQIDNATDRSMKLLGTSLDKGLTKARETIDTRSRQMVREMRGSMDSLQETIGDAMTYVTTTVNKAMQAFGIKGPQIDLASPDKKSNSGGGGGGKAGGGFIGQPGERGRDAVPTWLGRGEAVLNWAHQRVVEPALNAYYGFGLNDMFSRTDGFHAGTLGAIGYARGKAGVSASAADFNGHPTDVVPAVAALIAILQKNFPGLLVSSTTDGSSHAANSYHYKNPGEAVDMSSGDYGLMKRAADYIKSSGIYKSLLEGIHNPNLSVANGAFVDASYWGAETWAAHANHLHLALESLGKVAGGAVEMAKGVKKMTVEGTPGVIKDIAQAAVDKVRGAANKFINDKMPMETGEPGMDARVPGTLKRYDHVYAEHNSADGDWGGEQLAPNVVAAIAEWAGLPGVTFAQIAHGESNYRPGATGIDPGGTKGLGLWMITTYYNDALIAKYGGQKAMLNPIINAMAAKEIYDTQGIGAWYGTTYLTDPNAHYQGKIPTRRARGGMQQFALGGEIDGPEGAPLPIVAHAGEWILNKGQQAKAAMMAGLGIGQLRDRLGFTGGPTSFDGGGEPTISSWGTMFAALAQNFARTFRELFGGDPTFATKAYGMFAPILGDLHLGIQQFVASIAELGKTSDNFTQAIQRTFMEPDSNRPGNDERSATRRGLRMLSAVESVIGSGMDLFRTQKDNLADAMSKFFDGIAGDGGLLDQMAEAFTNLQTVMATRLTRAIVRINDEGKVIGRDLTPMQVINHELLDMRRQLKFLLGEKGGLGKTINQAKKALEYAENMTDDEAIKAAQEDLEKARKDGDKKAIKAAQDALAEAKRTGNQEAVDVANATLQNLLDRQRDMNSQIAEMQNSILEKMEERQQAVVDRINDQADRALTGFDPKTGSYGLEIRRRIAVAMGNIGKLPSLAEKQIEVLQDQQDALRKALNSALRRGNRDLARDLESQIADLQATIVEAIGQQIADAQEEIQRKADRRQVGIDFMNTLADVQEGYGNVESAQRLRGATLVTQRQSIQTQFNQVAALLQDALAKGMGEGVTGPLEDKLTELTGQMEQNTLAQYQNTIAIRQASIDAITSRQGFLGGVGESLKSIMETIGQITGTPNVAMITQLVQSAIEQLLSTGGNLRAQMTRFVNENFGAMPQGAMSVLTQLSNLHGQDFVSAISSLNLNEIIDSLGGPQSPLAQQFEALIQAIIDNEAALQQNTQELQTLQQQNKIQEFTSTAWSWFRSAIFNGMGGLLPQYAEGTPFYAGGVSSALAGAASSAQSLSTGAMLDTPAIAIAATNGAATMGSGMAATTTGQSTAAEWSRLADALGKDRAINIYGTDPSDAVAVASRVAFEAKIPTS